MPDLQLLTSRESRKVAAADLPTREDALRTALQKNPEVQEAIQKLAKALAAEGAAKTEFIPDVTGFVRYSYPNGVRFVVHNFGTVGVHPATICSTLASGALLSVNGGMRCRRQTKPWSG